MDVKPAIEESQRVALRARLQESLTASLHNEAPPDEAARALVIITQDMRSSTGQDGEFEFSLRDEVPVLDFVVRSSLLAMVDQSKKEGESFLSWQRASVMRLLEILAELTFGKFPGKSPLESPSLVFAILEDVVDMATLPECEQIFPFWESIGKFLTKTRSPQDQKSTIPLLGLLRTLNKLLKRLSKTRDSVLSGRILMFMASVWPLSERGAANFLGTFNSNVEVAYLQGTDLDAEGWKVDTAFYQTFWSLQEYFRKSPLLTASPSQAKFLDGVQVVLTRFAEQPIDRAADKVPAGSAEEGDAVYNTSYLTSPKLLNLQLQDPNFRRHFLLQVLYVLQWLQADRRNVKTVNKAGKGPANLTVEVSDRLAAIEAQSKQLLRAMPPNGSQFAALVKHVLEREKNWILWKYPSKSANDGRPASASAAPLPHNCPPIEREPLQGEAALRAPGKRKAVRRTPLGNEVLGRVWNSTRGDPMQALRGAKRRYVPDYMDYMKRVADEMDPENGIEEEYKVAKSPIYEWRGLRLSMRHNALVFGPIAKHGGDLTALLPQELRPKLSPSEQAKADAADENSQGGGEDAEEDEGGEEANIEKSEITSSEKAEGKDVNEGSEKQVAVERRIEQSGKSEVDQRTEETDAGDKMDVKLGAGVGEETGKEMEVGTAALEEKDVGEKVQEQEGTANYERMEAEQALPEDEEATTEKMEAQKESLRKADAEEQVQEEQVPKEERERGKEEQGKMEAGTAGGGNDVSDSQVENTPQKQEGPPEGHATAMEIEGAVAEGGQELVPEVVSRGDAPEVASQEVDNLLGSVQGGTIAQGTKAAKEEKGGGKEGDAGEDGGLSRPAEAEAVKAEKDIAEQRDLQHESAVDQVQLGDAGRKDEGKLADQQAQVMESTGEKELTVREDGEEAQPEQKLDLNATPPADADIPVAAERMSIDRESSPEVALVSEGGRALQESAEKKGGRGRGRGRGKRKSEGEPAKRVTRRKR